VVRSKQKSVELRGAISVRVRLAEKDPDLPDPTDFEIEGNPVHIAEALASTATVSVNLEQVLQELS
jgi:hypothetical protein